MNNLQKFLIAVGAGILLCLLLIGGYFLFFSKSKNQELPIASVNPSGKDTTDDEKKIAEELAWLAEQEEKSILGEKTQSEIDMGEDELFRQAQEANLALAKNAGASGKTSGGIQLDGAQNTDSQNALSSEKQNVPSSGNTSYKETDLQKGSTNTIAAIETSSQTGLAQKREAERKAQELAQKR
ncbi:hypothetical protein HMPREF9554_00772, partial [Treponema phagedenis F0421]